MVIPLIVPGLRGSGPDHWQTLFEQQIPGATRVQQSDWDTPDLLRWSITVANCVARLEAPAILIAHSFGALAAVAGGVSRFEQIQAAFLVAPADPVKFGNVHLLPTTPLPFPSMVVASTNDPCVYHEVARGWAKRWQSRFVSVGALGHINTESGHGPWPQGLGLLNELLSGAQLPRSIPRESQYCANAALVAA
jgi:predicted alpha/beta hydrolase family esterase